MPRNHQINDSMASSSRYQNFEAQSHSLFSRCLRLATAITGRHPRLDTGGWLDLTRQAFHLLDYPPLPGRTIPIYHPTLFLLSDCPFLVSLPFFLFINDIVAHIKLQYLKNQFFKFTLNYTYYNIKDNSISSSSIAPVSLKPLFLYKFNA